MIEKILNKKFKKSMFAGYDAMDVDAFFDNIIIYIKEMLQTNDRLKMINDQYASKNTELEAKIAHLEAADLEMKKEIDQYVKEGYSQRHINNKINNLSKEFQDLKKQNN